jgi:2-oxo-4-hydroxy-4-carboxy-5-ureidoimidazoline decarboxylase
VFEMRVDEFNALPADDARALVAGWLGVRRWVDEIVAGRPYADTTALRTRARDAALDLTDHELASALSRHPRIGERPTLNGAESRHSRSEQAGVRAADAERLRAANATYEQRFGHVFLVRAAGRTSDQILAELRRRLYNDEEAERAETVTALRDIALLRLSEVVR